MSADSESRARLCPEHRSDRLPASSCVACAQARHIAELEQTIERLAARVPELEPDTEDDAEKPIEVTIPESGSA
jgi:uncharacterized protein YdeI (YjbR/CyaY-like superfamily)